jgi:hypothetical protein
MPSRSRKLIRVNNGVVDVVNNTEYHWTVSNKNLARAEVPTIIIKEYQQNVSSIEQGIRYWANQAKVLTATGVTADPYEALYSVSNAEEGNEYTFPFYSTYHHIIQNAWGENKGVVGQTVRTVEEAVTQAARVVFPSAGIESAKSWEGTTPVTYQFSFQLLNTYDPLNDIAKNKELIRALIHNNLLDKIDFISVRPPAICEIRIPGIRGTTVGVLNTINVENMGQINRIDEVNVPDAYNITITVQELLTESRQIFEDELKDGKVFAKVQAAPVGVAEAPEAVTGATGRLSKDLKAVKGAVTGTS